MSFVFDSVRVFMDDWEVSRSFCRFERIFWDFFLVF